ncbi:MULTISPECIES: alpha/beta hydrolase family protein [unclassified Clostridium]|nr:alpha/beta fold hydrolase [Clostridium sp. HV4-5-A1G]KAA8676363.1 alpha/beta fold hydrolase [Clostridium sp. HV4-5-A1G]CAB1248256.1 2-succinyl-6-hydroxy-2, 4-cyclohexadiene-1-carboxylate synthase [Clostridiaceae bacterium BL-3]
MRIWEEDDYMDFKTIWTDPEKLDETYPAMIQGVDYNSGGSRILGVIYIAQGIGPHATVILLHGFPGYEQNFDLAHVLLRSGYNVLIFHYRGSWGSGGDYSIDHVLEDVESSIEFLKSDFAKKLYRIDDKNIILIGHSLGGFSALITAAGHDEIKSVGCIAGFNFGLYAENISKSKSLMDSAAKKWEKAVISLNGMTVQNFIDDIVKNKYRWNLLNISENLKNHSVLMIGGRKDVIAPLEEHYMPLVQSLKKQKVDLKEIILDGDHSFVSRRITLAKEVLKWLEEQKSN